MPALATLHALAAHWATLLGCRRADLHAAQTLAVAHGPGLVDYHGALAPRRDPAWSSPRVVHRHYGRSSRTGHGA